MSPEQPLKPAFSRLEFIRSTLIQYGWISVLIGYACLTLFVPGGEDGYNFYLRPYWPGATAPSWVFLLTAPVSPLAWPLRWTAFTIFSVVAALLAQRALGEKRWWIVLLNHAFFVNIWIGQIEIVTMIGVALSWLVMQRKIHPLWFGIGIVCLVTKVQVGIGLILLFAFWIFFEQGLRPLIWAAVTAAAIAALTSLIFPDWIGSYLVSLRTLSPQDQWWNGAIFPFGLIAIPFALIPGDVGKMRRARLVACATLLASPYFGMYHASTAMLLETRSAMTWLTWLDAIPRMIFGYTNLGWITPTVMILWDVWQIRRERQGEPASLQKA